MFYIKTKFFAGSCRKGLKDYRRLPEITGRNEMNKNQPYTVSSLSGTLAKRTRPTQNLNFAKSLPTRPAPTPGLRDSALKMRQID